jgi:hypothetical protein
MLRYLGKTVASQNLNYDEIKTRLTSGNTSYHSPQNLVSSHLLPAVILSVLLYDGVTL